MHYDSKDGQSVVKNWSHVNLINKQLVRGQLKVVSEVIINKGAIRMEPLRLHFSERIFF